MGSTGGAAVPSMNAAISNCTQQDFTQILDEARRISGMAARFGICIIRC